MRQGNSPSNQLECTSKPWKVLGSLKTEGIEVSFCGLEIVIKKLLREILLFLVLGTRCSSVQGALRLRSETACMSVVVEK